MSERLPSLRPRRLVRALENAGWGIVRQRGSHLSLRKEGQPFVVTVPMHNRDIPRGTLRGILDDAGISIEEFLELLDQ